MIGYISSCKDELIMLLLSGIQKITFESEDDDDDTWGVAMSSACCTEKVSLLIGNDVLAKVVEFVGANIQSEDWKNRYSALMALGAVTEGPDRLQFANILQSAYINLMNMFNDSNSKVREGIAWNVRKICEHHADFVLQSNCIQLLIEKML